MSRLVAHPPTVMAGAHSGYHWRGQTTRFFEGWYVRLTLPEVAQTFAFMFSIDDPAGGGEHSGGAAQVLGPDESYYCRSFPDASQFWAWPHQFGLGHWRRASRAGAPARYLQPSAFFQQVEEGYQVGANRHQGRLLTPAGVPAAEWDYQITPVYQWGEARRGKNRWAKATGYKATGGKATAGWLSYLPVFEPGWQVLMAHGLASGWVCWQGQRYTFEGVPAYAEKNWGGAFPAKWFWLQCNAFEAFPGLSITAVGGVRDVLTWQENVGLIGIHHEGRFYEFFSTKTAFTWTVNPWGYWQLRASDYRYRVEIMGRAADAGAWVRVPTREGLQWLCRDTTHGEIHVRLVEGDRTIIDARSSLAGLEVGGGPWDEPWELS